MAKAKKASAKKKPEDTRNRIAFLGADPIAKILVGEPVMAHLDLTPDAGAPGVGDVIIEFRMVGRVN